MLRINLLSDDHLILFWPTEPSRFHFGKPENYISMYHPEGTNMLYVGGQAMIYVLKFTDRRVHEVQVQFTFSWTFWVVQPQLLSPSSVFRSVCFSMMQVNLALRRAPTTIYALCCINEQRFVHRPRPPLVAWILGILCFCQLFRAADLLVGMFLTICYSGGVCCIFP